MTVARTLSASTICCSPRSRPAFSSCMDSVAPEEATAAVSTLPFTLIRVLSSFSFMLARKAFESKPLFLVEVEAGVEVGEDLVVAATTGVFSSLALPLFSFGVVFFSAATFSVFSAFSSTLTFFVAPDEDFSLPSSSPSSFGYCSGPYDSLLPSRGRRS